MSKILGKRKKDGLAVQTHNSTRNKLKNYKNLFNRPFNKIKTIKDHKVHYFFA